MLRAKQHGFKLRDHSLSLYGLCKDCAARDRERTNPMTVQRSHAQMHAIAKLPRRK